MFTTKDENPRIYRWPSFAKDVILKYKRYDRPGEVLEGRARRWECFGDIVFLIKDPDGRLLETVSDYDVIDWAYIDDPGQNGTIT